MKKKKRELSSLKVGIIDRNIKFRVQLDSKRETNEYKKKYGKRVMFCWITLPLKVEEGVIWNPKILIVVMLN